MNGVPDNRQMTLLSNTLLQGKTRAAVLAHCVPHVESSEQRPVVDEVNEEAVVRGLLGAAPRWVAAGQPLCVLHLMQVDWHDSIILLLAPNHVCARKKQAGPGAAGRVCVKVINHSARWPYGGVRGDQRLPHKLLQER